MYERENDLLDLVEGIHSHSKGHSLIQKKKAFVTLLVITENGGMK